MFARLVKKRDDSEDLVNCMRETVDKLESQETTAKKPGILLGKIQSGKTRAFIGVIALAFDRGYDIAIVLTKGTKALAEQTNKRLVSDFKEFIDGHEMQIFDILHVPENLVAWELRQKIVMIVKKETHNLDRVFRALMETYPDLQNRKILIIDDEADYASITFKRDKETGVIAQGVIAAKIDQLRQSVAKSNFLQVTATPYSLYLQPDDSLPEAGYTFLPKRPAFTVLLPLHKNYIGGDFYFADDVSESDIGYYVFKEISADELDAVRKSDGRRFNLNDVLTTRAIKQLRMAVMNFVVGACIRQIQQITDTGKEEYFSFVIHTERGRAAHRWQFEIVERLIHDFKNIAVEGNKEFASLIEEAYKDLTPSIAAAKLILPTLEDVIKKVVAAVGEERIMLTKVNSEIEVKQLLDENGQLRLRTPLNIFIGGQILDRGITVANLIGFYYGRNPQRFQQDTVLQHSRMYGARPLADLAVTRFYTTQRIYDTMRTIHEFDTALRDAFESGAHGQGVYFLRKDEEERIAPCSPNKILLSSIITLRPFKRFVPFGFQTVPLARLDRDIKEVDKQIETLIHLKEEVPVSIQLSEANSLLEKIQNTLEFEDDFDFDWESLKTTMGFFSKSISDTEAHERILLLVRRGRDNSRLRQDGIRFFDAPDTSHIEGEIARKYALTNPMLMLFRENGKTEQGWRGHPFWWPVIVIPRDAQVSIFASKTIK